MKFGHNPPKKHYPFNTTTMERLKKIVAGTAATVLLSVQFTAFADEIPGLGAIPEVDTTDVTGDLSNPLGGSYDFSKPVTGKVTISQLDEIKNDIVVEKDAELIVGLNADLSSRKITLNGAKSLSVGLNAKIGTVEGTVGTLSFDTNATVTNLSVRVTEGTELAVNSVIDNVHLATKSLDMDVNTSIAKGNIYVFGDLKGSVNTKFDGKLTVYRDTALSVNAQAEGRVCSLGKMDLGVNAGIKTYALEGLMGNLDPILSVALDDDAAAYVATVASAKEFDKGFKLVMDTIDAKNATAASLRSKLKAAKEEDKAGIESQIAATVSEKEAAKAAFLEEATKTFDSVAVNIDSDENAQSLFAKVRIMYAMAVGKEDAGLVYDLCSNSEVTGDVNAVYEKGGKVRFGGKSFKRFQAMKSAQEASLEKALDSLSDEKLVKLGNKIDVLLESMASKKSMTQKNQKSANLLLDLRELVRNEFLYD
ncbi:MAG: hypothetical protein QG650_304 [Patescibacteria group bacterium]|nr:hypothetical protein [Patescibacteria group bacterium]